MQDYISAKGEQDLAKNRLTKVKGVNWDGDARNYDPKTDCIIRLCLQNGRYRFERYQS